MDPYWKVLPITIKKIFFFLKLTNTFIQLFSLKLRTFSTANYHHRNVNTSQRVLK